MREIGGYIELDRYSGTMLHEGSTALNCGRNALAYLIRARGIRKILIPRFLCASVREVCQREGTDIRYYSVGEDFLPRDISLQPDEWLYVVNFYGQLSNDYIRSLAGSYDRLIVDNAQAYFQMPVEGIDTLYTCRKFFGVADGAFLYTDAAASETYLRDESFDRMRFLLGRFERTASEFYSEYAANNDMFEDQPIKTMSALTDNLLRGIDYDAVKQRRSENFAILHDALRSLNRLELTIPEGAFMYPLYIENGAEIRRSLQTRKIYIPTLWPDVFAICSPDDTEYQMAQDILPLPCDQRYNADDMRYIISTVNGLLKGE